MDTNLYVGNLPFDTTEDDLRELFAKAGSVVAVNLIKDRDTGRSRGFAFVEMGSQSEAEAAMKMYHGASMGNRELKVNLARPREERPRPFDSRRSGPPQRRQNRRTGGGGGYNRY